MIGPLSAKQWPLICCTGRADTTVTLTLPAVLCRAVDAIVAGHGIGTGGSGRWLAVAAGLLAVGVGTELISVYAGTACVAGTTAWLRNHLVRHLLAAGPRPRFDTGDVVSRVSGNAGEAAQAGNA